MKFSKAIVMAIATLMCIAGFQAVQAQGTITHTNSGTYTVPAGVTEFTVSCWGAGGGGSDISSSNRRGGGGGGGAFASKTVAVIPNSSYTISIGHGGAGNHAGGNTTFKGNVVVAAGGSPGEDDSKNGGSGGLADASTGDDKHDGGNGANGDVTNGYSGGGGGGAGSTGDGNDAVGSTAGAAKANNGGAGGAGRNGGNDGRDGLNYGGGGSGASTNSSTDRDGGVGADGYVVITYSCSVLTLDATTAAAPVSGSSVAVVTLSGSAIPNGTYTVTYNLSGANVTTGATSSVTFSSGSGSFNTVNLSSMGSTTVTIGKLTVGSCQSLTTVNNTATFNNSVVVYNANGNFLVPAGVYSVKVEAWGGGGGATRSNGGGGGGAYASSVVPVTPGAIIPITAGASGVGGSSTGPGGTSIFGANVVVAVGGQGAPSANTGGLGGAAASCTGTDKYSGGNGGPSGGNSGGGGGGSAFYNANGGNGGAGVGNIGGAGGLGTGNGGTGGSGSSAVGMVGFAPGGGGGAAGSNSNSFGGGGGRVMITQDVCQTPTITHDATAVSVCKSASAQTTTLSYSATTNAPNTYSIVWTALPVNTFAAVTDASLGASPITISVPAGTTVGTYTGTITVKNTGGCVSTGTTFTVDVYLPALPTFSTPPANTTVACGGVPAPSALAYSNGLSGTCLVSGSANSTFTATPGTCGGEVTETWEALDIHGRTITAVSRTITVSPAALPTMTPLADITITCNAVPAPSTLSFDNGLSGDCAISGTSELSTFTPTPGACLGTGVETWTATDVCGRPLASVSRNIIGIGIEGNYTVGAGGDFTTLTGATGLFRAINECFVSDNITVDIISNIAEPGLYALNQWTECGSGMYSMTIQPDAAVVRVLQGNFPGGIIRLNGADRVTIDGSFPGNNGRFLTIRGTNNLFPTMNIANASRGINVYNCNLEGGNTSLTSGVIFVGAASPTNPNSYIYFYGNLFQNYTTAPANFFYSAGTAARPNNTITLENNEFKNFSANGINVTATGNGIEWNINANAFYNTLGATTAQTAINFVPGNNSIINTISNNRIGGNNNTNGGIWTNSGAVTFKGISVNAGMMNMYYNSVQNVALTNAGQTNFMGLEVLGGTANVAYNTVYNNTMAGLVNFFGIRSVSTLAGTSISNNVISNATSTCITGYPNFYGIYTKAATIIRNKVANIGNSNAGAIPGIFGIEALGSTGIQTTCLMNMVSLNGGTALNPKMFGIQDNAYAAASPPWAQYYHNSVEISGEATTCNKTYAFQRNFNGIVDLQNNIFSNLRKSSPVGHYAISSANVANFFSDYNDLYVATVPQKYLGFWGVTNIVDLAAWKLATGQDVNSLSVAPSFAGINNLHLAGDNSLLVGAAPIIPGIPCDFDFDFYGPSYVTIGADEGMAPVTKLNAEVTKSSLDVMPNPFKSSIQMVVSVTEDSKTSLSIYNMMGEKVADIAEENMTTGSKTFNYDANALPAGLYVCRMIVKSAGKTDVIVKRIIKD